MGETSDKEVALLPSPDCSAKIKNKEPLHYDIIFWKS
jgi:hypothetical protein